VSVASLVEEIRNQFPGGIPEVTISGGEPTDQLEELGAFTEALKALGAGLILYSGRTLPTLRKMPLWGRVEASIDVLIDGPFVQAQPESVQMKGSKNQKIHLFTDRYHKTDFDNRLTSIRLTEAGEIVILGFPSQEIINLWSS